LKSVNIFHLVSTINEGKNVAKSLFWRHELPLILRASLDSIRTHWEHQGISSTRNRAMSEASAPHPQPDADRLDAAADQAIAACGGDAREAVKALLIANEYLENELETQVSRGYMRGVRHGRFKRYSG
jgi:hypothetical protein